MHRFTFAVLMLLSAAPAFAHASLDALGGALVVLDAYAQHDTVSGALEFEAQARRHVVEDGGAEVTQLDEILALVAVRHALAGDPPLNAGFAQALLARYGYDAAHQDTAFLLAKLQALVGQPYFYLIVNQDAASATTPVCSAEMNAVRAWQTAVAAQFGAETSAKLAGFIAEFVANVAQNGRTHFPPDGSGFYALAAQTQRSLQRLTEAALAQEAQEHAALDALAQHRQEIFNGGATLAEKKAALQALHVPQTACLSRTQAQTELQTAISTLDAQLTALSSEVQSFLSQDLSPLSLSQLQALLPQIASYAQNPDVNAADKAQLATLEIAVDMRIGEMEAAQKEGPQITMKYAGVEVADGGTVHVELGAQIGLLEVAAKDTQDGDISASVQTEVKNSAGIVIPNDEAGIDTNTPETYTIKFSVPDADGNIKITSYTLEVSDTIAPTWTKFPTASDSVSYNASWNPLNGVEAQDASGPVTYTVTPAFNPILTGKQTLTITAKDASGNASAPKTRVVYVAAPYTPPASCPAGTSLYNWDLNGDGKAGIIPGDCA